jgi:hypothetical protein
MNKQAKINRTALLLLTVLLITAVFAGCATKKNTTTNTSNTSQTSPTSATQPNITNNSNADVTDNTKNPANFANMNSITPNIDIDVDINEYLDKFRQITDDMTLEEIHQLVGEANDMPPTGIFWEYYYVNGINANNGRVTLGRFGDGYLLRYAVTINNYGDFYATLPETAGNLDKFRNIDKNYTREQVLAILGKPDESHYEQGYDVYNVENGTVSISYFKDEYFEDGTHVLYEEIFL